MTTTAAIPIACRLGALDPASRERRSALAGTFMTSARQIVEIDEGYALHVDSSPEPCRNALEWFLLEQRCCPFLRLELELVPGGTALWLRLSGGTGVKEFLQSLGFSSIPAHPG